MEKNWNAFIVGTKEYQLPQFQEREFPNTGGDPSGFVEFKPGNEETQRKYDAMSSGWLGADASEANANLFKTTNMPVDK